MKKPIPLSIVTKISKILAALSILFLVASRGLAPGMLAVVFLIAALISAVGDIIFIILFYRCPHC